ncbi:ABC transporter ATP-binding protein [Sporolactobacillus sp. KGMB 08714]|uniref:ABC transporter ATP-binding protein n=1 Tax=Sporolactobacillus sp. KGMB 08714 TaxID=3064704 RepID=UPI002FBE52B1
MNPITEYKNVSYWYKSKDQKVLSNISYSFNKGTFYTLLGPSGSGKTTFISLAAGLDNPSEGEVLYEGTSIKKIGLGEFRKKYVSIIFQQHNLLNYMTGIENIVSAMSIRKIQSDQPKQQALNFLKRINITEEKAKQKILTLSGGEQQRIAIARALCSGTDLIIADEPTGSLDPQTSREIINIFIELAHQENKCIIMVTHDDRISELSDCQLRLQDGHLQEMHAAEKI